MNRQTLKDLKSKVEHILQKYPETRNSDIVLTRMVVHEYLPHYCQKIGDIWWYHEDSLYIAREDQIKRIRAKFNEKSLYLPTNEEVLKKRRLNEETWRKQLGLNPEMRTV